MAEDFLLADWPAPTNVRCLVTTRRGGASRGPWASFNLGQLVDDDPAHVLENRRRLRERLDGLTCRWIRQVHGTSVVTWEANAPRWEGALMEEAMPEADAAYTSAAATPCAILTADCLPVAFCDSAGREVAVAHAGWRGLCGGVLETTLSCFHAARGDILAWLGPAIGPCHFEVGGEVRQAFLDVAGPESRDAVAAAFMPGAAPGKWMADLYAIARARLRAAGVENIHGGGRCTVCDETLFYSYRRERVTGRFATLIYRL